MADDKLKWLNTYYRNLARLFRSGPVVKQRIANKIAPPGTSGMPIGTAKAFLRSNSSAYASQLASYGNYSRLSRYSDYSEMETMAEVSSGLDIYADECLSKDEYGDVIKIHSTNNTIKETLEELFYDVLRIDYNAWTWIRSLCKYGDHFLLVDHHPDYGVLGLYPMPVNEVEREEGYDKNDPTAYRYRWITQGNRILENWQVIHFRILGNDVFLPYGSSVIEPARRVWRQLILMEDAVMVYRIVRSPERRVFYVDVGNIAPADVPKYIEKVQTQLKRNMVIDTDTGQVDQRYNALPVHKDSPIALLDGRIITIEQLSKETKTGNQNWVYSIRDKDKQLVPGKVIWCDRNYTAKKLIKVTLDDGTYCLTAPDHPFVMRDGTHKRADELTKNDSLMPLYRKINEKGYEEVYNPKTEKYEKTHLMVAKDLYKERYENEKSLVVHHKEPWNREKNKLNNDPKNLEIMNFWDHKRWHQEQCQYTIGRPEVREASRLRLIKYNVSDEKKLQTIEDNKKYKKAQKMGKAYNHSELHKEHDKIRSEAQKRSWAEDRDERIKVFYPWVISDECMELARNIYIKNPNLNREQFIKEFKKDEKIREILLKNNKNTFRDLNKISRGTLEKKFDEMGFGGFVDFKKDCLTKKEYKNHKVEKVEIIDANDDVYCMTVVGPNGEQDRHNFVICMFKNDKEISNSLILLKNSTDEDYFLPVRGDATSTRIETLPGGQFTGDIEDLNYIQNKLFAALKIPKSYLGYEGDVVGKCLHPDTLIPLLNGQELTIKQISEDINNGKKLYTYTLDEKTLTPIVGEIIKAGITKRNATMVEVLLDNNKSIKCTPEHKFMLRDGTYKEAQYLKPNDSLMPLYKKISSKENGDYIDGYEKIYSPNLDKFEYTHKLVADYKKIKQKNKVIHHKNFYKLDNTPENLDCSMTWKEHRKFHSILIQKTMNSEKNILKRINDPNWLKSVSEAGKIGGKIGCKSLQEWREQGGEPWNKGQTKENNEKLRECGIKSQKYKNFIKCENPNCNNVFRQTYSLNSNTKLKKYCSLECCQKFTGMISGEIRSKKCQEERYKYFVKKNCLNCNKEFETRIKKDSNFCCRSCFLEYKKNKSIKKCLWCGKNFYSRLSTNNVSSEDGRSSFCNNSCKMHYLNEKREKSIYMNHKVVAIKYLEEKVDCYDLTIDSFPNFAVSAGVYLHNSTLSQEDVRFARTIRRIQQLFIGELNKIAMIHLFSMGYKDEDLLNFEVTMSNPSIIEEMQRQ